MTPAIDIEGLTKVYHRTLGRQPIEAVAGLRLSVAPGEIFGLLGPNGAGKTTLVKMLLGVVHPTAGQAALFGTVVGDPEARRPVGFLPENHRYPDFLTPDQLLDLYGRLGGVPVAERRQRAGELLERVDMLKWRHTRIKKFSKGMMQRLGLAQALINQPRLVFLDEPTDGVDPLGRRAIRDLLLWLRDEGLTVFLNSHLLSEVEQVCTRVAIMHEGRLVRTGTVAEMTAVERAYTLRCTPIPPPLLHQLADRITLTPMPNTATPGIPAATDGDGSSLAQYRLLVAHRDELNALLDRLRGAGVAFEAVQPVRQSLEESFVQVITHEHHADG